MQRNGTGNAGGEGSAAPDAKLGIRAREMGSDCQGADAETPPDGALGEPLRDQHSNLQLTGREEFGDRRIRRVH